MLYQIGSLRAQFVYGFVLSKNLLHERRGQLATSVGRWPIRFVLDSESTRR